MPSRRKSPQKWQFWALLRLLAAYCRAMLAVRVTGQGTIGVRDVEPAAGDGVRVKVVSAGICGSDLHLMAMGFPAVTLGHEFAGLLDDGTAVAIEPVAACGQCDGCRAGHEQRCREILQRIYGLALDGGMADQIVVDPRCVIALPDTIDVSDASLVEPLAIAVHGFNRAGVSPGERVLVIGGGSIGLSALAVARHRGVVADLSARHRHQLAAGEALGANTSPGDDYDVVIDAAGTQSSIEEAIQRLRPGGRVLLLGSWWAPVELGSGLAIKEITLFPSSMYGHDHGSREFAEAVDVLAARPDLGANLITHRFPLADAVEGFRVAADRAAGAIKVVLHPQ
jgi:2-desacetyl-2-hydroxyethyl bacteriochlorophyllide A dehydrogenase